MAVICGMAPDEIPWGEDEVWCLAHDRQNRYKADRVFEMHDMSLLQANRPRDIETLKDFDTLYMQEKYFDHVTRYPFEEVAEVTGWYWNSSIAYMLALAVYEGQDIHLCGVMMKGNDEYAYQRPNVEYLLGLAAGRGLKVSVSEESTLLQFTDSPFKETFDGRYGWQSLHTLN